MVVVAFVAVAAVLVGTFTATRSASHAPFVFTKGDPDSSIKTKAGIANEGPDGSLAAQLEAQRAYPADAVPAAATANSQATFADLSKHGKGQGAWESIGPSQAKYPAVLDQFLAGRQGVHGLRARHRARDRRLQEGEQVLPVPRCGRRRRVGSRQGDRRERERATGSSSPAHSARTRSARCSSIRATRRATPSTRAPVSRTPRATRRPVRASTSRPTEGTRGRSFPAATSSRIVQSRRWRSTGRATCSSASPARSAASARSPAARSAARRRHGCAVRGVYRQTGGTFTLASGDQHPRHDQGRGRSEQLERALPGLVRRGCLALARQRCDVDSDQDRAEPGTER